MRGDVDQKQELIKRLYEAASLPDRWPDLLRDIAQYGGGENKFVFFIVGDC